MSIFFGSTGAGDEQGDSPQPDNHRGLSPTLWSAITAAVFALCAGITALIQAQPMVIVVFALGAVAAAGLSAWYTTSDGRAVSTEPAAPSATEFSLAHAMDALPGGIVVVDEESRPLYANATFQTLSGDLSIVPAHAIAAMLGSEEAESALADRLQDLEAKARRGEIGVADLEVHSPTGELAWWRTTARPIPGMPGRLILWQLEDITENRHMEQAVESEREKVLEFLADAPIGFYAVDPQGHFLFANEALARLLEVPVKDLLSQRYRLSDFLPAVAAGDMTLEEALGDRHGHDEIVLRSRSGNARPVSISQSVGQDQSIGRPITRGIVRDLASDREFEVALRRSEQRFRSLFDKAPVGIALVGRDGQIGVCNQAFARMLDGDADVSGQQLADLVGEADREALESALSETLSGEAETTQIEVQVGAGARNAGLFVRRLGADENAGLMVQVIDTTEQRSLEAQFTQSQKMQAVGQLAGGIAHDFNNLLTAMVGFCDLLLLRHKPGDQSFADVMQIKQNANRAANLVRQLLAFSRQQTLQPRVISVTDTLGELSNLLRRLIGEGIELRMVHGRDLGPVKVDQGQLEQVIINLAVNGRDAMASGGTLTIQTANLEIARPQHHRSETVPAGAYVSLEVSDTGCGIPPDLLERIFEPFFTTKEVGTGTGLGLSTVYGIVRQTGGYVLVDSTVDQGTTFRILLPQHLGEDETDADADGQPSQLPQDLTGAGTILLVEDEDPVRLFAARALRSKGYKVLEAKTPESALDIVENETEAIDLLITDVVMPRMDGPTLVQEVRGRLPNIRVLCMSGYAEETLADRIEKVTDAQFLAKPFSLNQLAGKVKEVMLAPPPGKRRPPADPTGQSAA